MEKWFNASLQELTAISLTAIGIYLAVMLLTRISGKRSFSKMSSFDFAMTVSIGSIVATAIISKSVSLLSAIMGLTMVYALQLFVATLRNVEFIRNMVDNKPLLLMDGNKILEENLKKAKVTKSDLIAKLREANVLQFKHVKAVIFESTGDISVLHSESDTQLHDVLLEGVNRD
ncbi:hypothetical protein HME9304_02316 [Flagellimonas maritima]|uniref:DUF421 domain-containing protein n=1 Tax=Flagellimonas maritima TaxID=1383885 RepID=A0A2Z4LU89_9FLAO|nr:YetF domain-containing protein [Allomuricauda aurantiaca]AWX45303.1 hypothetical protein HME9304_02316 [Allomuricauda aurantiaca]